MIDWQPGKLLKNGKYSLTRELGQGGFGITYLAKNQDGQPVVIKTLNTTTIHQQSLNFEKFKEDFYQEAIRLAKCSHHSHIVNIIELIPDVEGLPCIVMEYVSGQTLFELVQQQGFLSSEIALAYIEQIGSALQSVHQQGILHRDIKPHNILIRDNQKDAVLIDFGIAREFDPKKVGAHLTSFESQGYTPIEQLASYSKYQSSYYTDVYGLAATLYFILTGQTPVDARNRALFASQEKDPLIPPQSLNPKIDNKLSQAILEGMEIYPENRPQTISTWLNLLRETSPKLSYSTTIQSVPPSVNTNQGKPTLSTPPISKKEWG